MTFEQFSQTDRRQSDQMSESSDNSYKMLQRMQGRPCIVFKDRVASKEQ